MGSGLSLEQESVGTLIKYLFSKARVDKRTGCYLWQGAKNADGYGQVVVSGKRWFVHRLSFQLFIGNIPLLKGASGKDVTKWVRHYVCDNPKCFNPSHLRLGDPDDNTRDMLRAKRGRNQYKQGYGRKVKQDAYLDELTEKARYIKPIKPILESDHAMIDYLEYNNHVLDAMRELATL
jgi:HNH endonuclease